MAVVLITGASSGIGRSLARRMAASGDAVAVVARRESRLAALVEEIEKEGGRALALVGDVTDRARAHEVVREVEERLGPVDVLVANAGGGGRTRVDELRAEQIEAVLQLNVVGVANFVEAVLPGMLERRRGQIVAVSSLAGSLGLPTSSAYGAAKAALSSLMDSLRIDLRPRGIAVTLVIPGPVRLKPKSKKKRIYSVDVEDATARIEDAIRRKRARLVFPRRVSIPLALVRLLPTALSDRLLEGRGDKPEKN